MRGYGALLWIVAGSLAIRLLMVFVVHPACDFDAATLSAGAGLATAPVAQEGSCLPLRGDAGYIYLQGQLLSEGNGLADPVRYLTSGQIAEGSARPPATALLVGLLSSIGLTSPDAARAVLAAIGSLTTGVLGYAAWSLAGRRAGIMTGCLAAVCPMLVINDWRLLNETFVAFFFSVALVSAYRFWARPSVLRAVVLGVSLGLTGYARNEGPLLFVLLVIPLAWGLRQFRPSARAKLVVISGLAGLAVILPLWLFNASRFEEPVLFGNGAGWGLRNGTCDDTWFGDEMGYLSFRCYDGYLLGAMTLTLYDPTTDERDLDGVFLDRTQTYIERNAGRLPAVAAARVGRIWHVYEPVSTTQLDVTQEDRGRFDPWAALGFFYVSLPFAVAGGLSLYRRRIPLSPLLAPVVLSSLVAAGSFGLPRYRVLADVALVVAAGVGADAAWRRWGRRTADRQPDELTVGSSVRAPRGSPGVEVAAARAAERPRSLRPMLLAVVVAATAGVLVTVVSWSTTVEPAGPDAGELAEGAVLDTCLAIERADPITGLSDPAGFGRLVAGLQELRSVGADPAVRQAAESIQRIVIARTSPVSSPAPQSPAEILAQWAPGELQELREAIITIGAFKERHC